MFQSKNKYESKALIEKLNLNRFPEEILHKTDYTKIQSFFDSYPCELYVVRDADNFQAPYFFIKNYEECLQKIEQYKRNIIIAVSVNAYKSHKVLLGTIEISGDHVDLCARTDENGDHRNIFIQPEINISTNIFDKKLNQIPGFDIIYAFLVEKNLVDIIVEFTLYDIPVGVKNERLTINEIRNY